MANNYILNQEVFNKAVEEYRKELPNTRPNELFKWQAVQWFQDHWDIDAEDFPAMLDQTLAKTQSLLASNMFFPRKMIVELAKFDTKTVRNMFIDLFDENKDLLGRCQNFEEKSSELISLHKPKKMSYQNFNTISTYLWLRYPDKYYIYKSGDYREIASQLFNLEKDDLPSGTKKRYEELIQCIELYDVLNEALRKDIELIQMSDAYLVDGCYLDELHHILAVDFVFFITQQAKTNINAKTYLFSWNPNNWPWDSFNEDRSECLQNDTVIHRWTCASHKKIQVGDSFFMVRLGNEPRGIFASGTVISDAYDADHWDESGKLAKYVDLEFDTILDPTEINLSIPMLDGMVSQITPQKKFNWTPQSSGIEIPKEYIQELINLWSQDQSNGRNKNSSEENSIFHNPSNQIFYGPPGTGKTYKIQDTARNYMNGKYEIVTFHQSFSYEDFVEGIRASTNGNDEIQYKIEDGIFKIICDKARKEPNKKFAIFIDEINRGNIANIFGELITLIEPDKRQGCENELSITLPYSKTLFSVPQNLDIYGTMNTSDHSLTKLDLALRRRFEFVELLPNYELLKEKIIHTVYGVEIWKLLKIMNERIEILLGRDHLIGHSYFLPLGNAENKERTLANIFKNKIIPLLQEYFFDDWERIQWVLNDQNKKNEQFQFIKLMKNNNDKNYLTKLFGGLSELNHISDRRYQINKDAFEKAEAYSKIFVE